MLFFLFQHSTNHISEVRAFGRPFCKLKASLSKPVLIFFWGIIVLLGHPAVSKFQTSDPHQLQMKENWLSDQVRQEFQAYHHLDRRRKL